MRNNSNNLGLVVLVVIGLLVFGIMQFANYFNLDMATSALVFTRHVIFFVFLAGVIYFINDTDIRFVSILPISIVGYLVCWLPAFDYWAQEDFKYMSFDSQVVTYAWYATGWIQVLIAIAIISIGHLTLYYFNKKNGY